MFNDTWVPVFTCAQFVDTPKGKTPTCQHWLFLLMNCQPSGHLASGVAGQGDGGSVGGIVVVGPVVEIGGRSVVAKQVPYALHVWP